MENFQEKLEKLVFFAHFSRIHAEIKLASMFGFREAITDGDPIVSLLHFSKFKCRFFKIRNLLFKLKKLVCSAHMNELQSMNE